jgi:DHA1 family tetracycline resistance protein-like MFS transporter
MTSKVASKSLRSPIFIIFITVFIDLVGFGIILPLSPFLARQFSASPLEIGWLMSIYSIMQFLFSPVWGSLSDRIGRRPVILISLLGGALSYIGFAFSRTLWLLFIARGMAGVFGGNISTAQAYIADVTKPEERSKGMGLIGAAFGLGFIFGPLIGSGLGWWGQTLGSEPPLGMSFSALGAALLCSVNLLFAFFVLHESLPPEKRAPKFGLKRPHRLMRIYQQLRRPVVGNLIVVFFLSGLAMAQMESMLFPYVADVFQWDLRMASYGFAYIGVLMVITQGYFIRIWMPKYGEPRLLLVGLGLFAISLLGIGLSSSVVFLAISMTILALGNGLMRPPNLGIISLMTPPQEQGAAMGVTNSLASLGRIIGPIFGGYMYERAGKGSPFFSASVMALLAFALVYFSYDLLPSKGKKSADVEVPQEAAL